MDINQRLSVVADRFTGQFAVLAEHLGTGEEIAFGPVDETMETASVIKLPVLVEALRQCQTGRLQLETRMTPQPEDFVKGSGLLQHLSPDISLGFRDVLTLMIIVSDNLATNMVLRTIGLDAVNEACHRWGLDGTTVHRKIAFDVEDPLGTTTARDMAHLLKRLYRHELLDDTYTDIALDILGRQQFQTLLTRSLPYDLLDDNDDEPPQVRVLSKSGSLTGVRNDAGLVLTPWGDYVVALFSRNSADLRFHVDTEAQMVLPEVSRAVFDHFCPTFAD